MYKAEINTILEHLDYAYQPIRDMKSGTVVGYEALIRGSDTYKNLTPNEIFDEAYKMNYLYALDIKLREKAIDTIKDKLISTDLKLFYNSKGESIKLPPWIMGYVLRDTFRGFWLMPHCKTRHCSCMHSNRSNNYQTTC